MVDRPTSPADALVRLLDGNRRFVAGTLQQGSGVDTRRRVEVAEGQAPFAAVLTCADSRVSPTLVFDAGLGDLFTCRNAGNQIDMLTVGSLEFAVDHCGCRVVAVMGHTACGAVTAAVEAARRPGSEPTPALADVVRRLLPALLIARNEGAEDVDAVGRVNVRQVCRDLVARSDLIEKAVAVGRLAVVGLWYDLHSGRVDVVTGPTEPS